MIKVAIVPYKAVTASVGVARIIGAAQEALRKQVVEKIVLVDAVRGRLEEKQLEAIFSTDVIVVGCPDDKITKQLIRDSISACFFLTPRTAYLVLEPKSIGLHETPGGIVETRLAPIGTVARAHELKGKLELNWREVKLLSCTPPLIRIDVCMGISDEKLFVSLLRDDACSSIVAASSILSLAGVRVSELLEEAEKGVGADPYNFVESVASRMESSLPCRA